MNKKNEAPNTSNSNPSHTFSQFLPDKVDSVDVLYFKKPFTDSERYQRFFSVSHVKNSSFLTALNTVLHDTIKEDLLSPKKCKSEGKIIVPLKGDAFKIIYFSRKESKCPYLYIIENGHFLYYEMDSSLNRLLNKFEAHAIEP